MAAFTNQRHEGKNCLALVSRERHRRFFKTGTLEETFDWAKETKLNSAVNMLLAKNRNEQTPLDLLKDCPFILEETKAQLLQQRNGYSTDA
jgi:hypothetical protein